ncbi:MAG: GGDEF domain-containing protein [Deltaproteobacteria bacterium]|nr:GGDEF domain-containing protein [Deltaproteobacteria bacterium]
MSDGPHKDLAPTLEGAFPTGLIEAIQESTGLRGSLLVIAGSAADLGTHQVVGDEVVLGRDPNQLLLRDPQISRRHARVFADTAVFFLEDLGSTNGTLLNGEPVVERKLLRNGDTIQLGHTTIKFALVDPAEAAVLERMAALAGTDPLTGLMAKHRFDAMLTQCFDDAQSKDTPLSVLMMDMDGLKAINTEHGHPVGAHTISEVGRLIGRIVGLHGEACRFGGDEFSALLPGSPISGGLRIAERIRQAVEEATFSLGEVEVSPTISIGVAEISPDRSSVRALVIAADQALYRAKDQGRNAVSD